MAKKSFVQLIMLLLFVLKAVLLYQNTAAPTS